MDILDILRHARDGACTCEDLRELRKLVLTSDDCDIPNFDSPPWQDAILITSRNSGELSLSERMVIAQMSEEETGNLPIKSDLAIGMKVMIAEISQLWRISQTVRGELLQTLYWILVNKASTSTPIRISLSDIHHSILLSNFQGL
ncbi:hypothetical protein JVU11DRAFT_9263 [Chiua virens]|nr:hypothetical protein JVU11DRAFT_9263 [Chiua virens]